MSPELINLTLPVVIAEIENVLEDYPEYPYQVAFSMPELRQRLLAHVLTHTPNRYTVAGEKLTLKAPKFPYPSAGADTDGKFDSWGYSTYTAGKCGMGW